MRIHAFRAWLTATVNQGLSSARRAGMAIHKRIRDATGKVEVGVGVGDDESSFGGGRARVWWGVVEGAREKILSIFERSFFERRFPRLEKLVRRLLGAAPKKEAPKLETTSRPRQLGAHTPPNAEESARYRAQIQQGIMNAHTHEHAGLRENMSRRLRHSSVDPDEEREQEQQEDSDSDSDEDFADV